jgi:hypothetical protein
VRLTGTIYTLDGRTAEVTLKVTVQDLPASASVTVTDVVLQPGETASGPVPNPREAGSTEGAVQYRSGVVPGDMDLVLISNADRASPTRVALESTFADVRVGSYRFGTVRGSAAVDGAAHTATQGWGRAPVITERCDLTIPAAVDGGRAHLRVQWTDRGTGV